MRRRARAVTKKPESVRRSQSVDPEVIERLHAGLGAILIRHGDPDDVDTDTLRAQFHRIRDARNKVQRIVSKLLPKLGTLRSDLARIDATIAAESAVLVQTSLVDHLKNDMQRKAKLRDALSDWHAAKADITADLDLIEQAVSHAKWVREELRYAFEEASRSLASIELEQRLSR